MFSQVKCIAFLFLGILYNLKQKTMNDKVEIIIECYKNEYNLSYRFRWKFFNFFNTYKTLYCVEMINEKPSIKLLTYKHYKEALQQSIFFKFDDNLKNYLNEFRKKI